MHEDRKGERGVALLAVVVLAAFLMVVLGSYFFITGAERGSSRSAMQGTRGFYAAEAGLNVRYQQLRSTFDGYALPSGSPPPTFPGELPCQDVNQGSGDFACSSIDLQDRNVVSFVTEDPASPREIVIPRGEEYQNLRASEYEYTIRSVSTIDQKRPQAIIDMRLASRLVPLFQFAVFYNKDLEILPGPAMTFNGPVHTNGDLYFGAATSLTIDGQVTAKGKIFNGRKDSDCCNSSSVMIYDPSSPRALPTGTDRVEVLDTDIAPWNGMIRMGGDMADVPAPEALDPVPGSVYWDSADLRVVLNLSGGTPPPIEVRDPTGAVDVIATGLLTACAGAVDETTTMYNFRESTSIQMLEVDVQAVFDCVDTNSAVMGGKALDDSTQGGLVWHLSVIGPDSAGTSNNYGVRVKNAAELASTNPMAPQVRGFSVVTDQALYIEGDYNAVNKKPAAFLTDSLNVLSNNWSDANSADVLSSRMASTTTINAAFLAGTDSTGGDEGTAFQDLGNYSGGLENYPRFHEDWSSTGVALNYLGSFISLNQARHVDGPISSQSYSPPIRNWGYDADFNDADKLPPLAPRFVYIRQDLFVRSFDY